jgi:hypothetical protein
MAKTVKVKHLFTPIKLITLDGLLLLICIVTRVETRRVDPEGTAVAREQVINMEHMTQQ